MQAILKASDTISRNLPQSSPHTKKIELKINKLQQLEPGWDFGEGEAISDEVANKSLELAEHGLLLGLNANVNPSVDGSIVLSLFHIDRFLFISVRPDNLFDVVYEKGIGVDYEILDSKEDLDLKSVKEYIEKWVLSEHCTSSNTTKMPTALEAMPLRNIKMAGSPFLTKSVQSKQAESRYAITSNDFTTRQSAIQYASAKSMNNYYKQTSLRN